MSVPAFLRAVDGQIYIDALCFAPDLLDFFELYKVVRRAGTVEDIDGAVISAVVKHIIDDGAQRRQTDTTGDKQQIFPFQLCLNREMIAVWTADGNLVAHLQAVQIIRQHSAFFDAEFLEFFICRRGGDGKHTLADAGRAEHCALSRHMFKQLAALRRVDAERLYVRRFLADVGNHAHHRNQRISGIIFMTGTFAHCCSPPAAFSSENFLITFTIFRDAGHFSTQRPQPTQEYIPSLFAGKYTSLCIKRWRNRCI